MAAFVPERLEGHNDVTLHYTSQSKENRAKSKEWLQLSALCSLLFALETGGFQWLEICNPS
jgi:hypothetical protein